jgi:hypothetical protein
MGMPPTIKQTHTCRLDTGRFSQVGSLALLGGLLLACRVAVVQVGNIYFLFETEPCYGIHHLGHGHKLSCPQKQRTYPKTVSRRR